MSGEGVTFIFDNAKHRNIEKNKDDWLRDQDTWIICTFDQYFLSRANTSIDAKIWT